LERKISIRQGSKEATLDWIMHNNKYSSTFTYQSLSDSLEHCIQRVKKNAMKDWDVTFSGTAGFTVFFMPEDENYGTIEVLVDPALGGEYEFEIIWEGN